MLNILWVDDDEHPEQKQISWFKNRKVSLINDFTKAKKEIISNLNQFDLIVLDINLTNSEVSDEIIKITKEFRIKKELVKDEKISPEKLFLEESGMYLYLKLIEHGFPKNNIVFLSSNADEDISRVDDLRRALKQEDYDEFDSILEEIRNDLDSDKNENVRMLVDNDDIEGLFEYLEDYYESLINTDDPKNTYNRFCSIYRRCRIDRPEAFNIKLQNKSKYSFNLWLENHEKNDYLVLRRGIIEACQHLKQQKLRFDKFCKDGKNTFLDIDDYLATLENFLPLQPSDKKTLYKLFIRTLAHEWEESVEPKELDDKGSYAFSWVMKMTRNWIAHNSTAIFTDLTEQDVAYLFICNMRAMFDLDDKAQPYENYLLSLFKKVDDEKIKNKDIPLIEFYVSYFNERTNKTDVHDILNDLQKDKAKLKDKGDKFFIDGLYHCFWFLTSLHKSQKDKAKPNLNNPNQVFISRHYTFEFFNYEKTEFLFELARHIYSRSFLQE